MADWTKEKNLSINFIKSLPKELSHHSTQEYSILTKTKITPPSLVFFVLIKSYSYIAQTLLSSLLLVLVFFVISLPKYPDSKITLDLC